MIVRREVLKAALPFTTSKPERYALDSLQVNPDGSVVATNGRVLVVARDRMPFKDEDFPLVPGAEFHGSPEQPILLHADTAARLLKSMPKKSPIPILLAVQVSTNGSPAIFTVAATDLESPIVSTIKADENATFPDIDRMLSTCVEPDSADAVSVVLGVEVLTALLKSASGVGATGIRVTIPTRAQDRAKPDTEDGAPGDVIGPLRFEMRGGRAIADGVEVSGVAMPMRR